MFHFLVVKFSVYLNRLVFVMVGRTCHKVRFVFQCATAKARARADYATIDVSINARYVPCC